MPTGQRSNFPNMKWKHFMQAFINVRTKNFAPQVKKSGKHYQLNISQN